MIKYLKRTPVETPQEIVKIVIDDGEEKRSAEKERRAKRNAEVKRHYEQAKRCRKFNERWKKSFPWVTVNKDDKMFCETCVANTNYCEKESKFVKGGCANFHVKSLQTHHKSQGHKRCAEREKAMAATPGTNPAERALQSMNEQNFNKLRILFRVAHSIAKKNRPFQDYIWSLDLHEAMHGISLGETYRNIKACRNFVLYIAEVERMAMVEVLKKVPFYSILSDGSTDSSICEAEIMYVRYSDKGKISNKFLALKNVPRANAENLTKLLENTLKEYGGFTDENPL